MIRNESDPVRVRLGSIAAAAVLAAWSVGCATAGPPRPEIGYRARGTVEITNPAAENPVRVRFVEFHRTGKRRRDLDLVEIAVWIDRPDLRVTWVLNPKAKSYEEYPISRVDAVIEPVPDPFGPRARVHFEPLGSETLEGVDTQKFAVEGETISGHAWLTHDRIPLRFSGTFGRKGSPVGLQIDYEGIVREEQANHLFEIPMNYAGYEKRKQKSMAYVEQGDEAARSLKEQQWGTQPPPPPPMMPQIPSTY
jgi:hypothetical protein